MHLALYGGIVKSTPFQSRYWSMADSDSPDRFKSGLTLTLTIVGQYVTVVGASHVEDMVQEAVTALALFVRGSGAVILSAGKPEIAERLQIYEYQLAAAVHEALRIYFQDYQGIRTNQKVCRYSLPMSLEQWLADDDLPEYHRTAMDHLLLLKEDQSLALIDLALDFASLNLSGPAREVLTEILAGKTVEQVADRLEISVRTVQRRLADIYAIAENHFQ